MEDFYFLWFYSCFIERVEMMSIFVEARDCIISSSGGKCLMQYTPHVHMCDNTYNTVLRILKLYFFYALPYNMGDTTAFTP